VSLRLSNELGARTIEIAKLRDVVDSPISTKKGKGFTYSVRSVGPGADSGVQAVSPQMTISHPPGVKLQLLSARSALTFPVAEHHRPLAVAQLHHKHWHWYYLAAWPVRNA